MNDLCYELSQNAVGLNSFDCVFVHKELNAQTKLKLKTDCNMQTKNHHYQVI